SCTVRSWRRRIRLCGRFPYRPTIGGACGMYRPPIGPVSAIERAIVCMRMPGLADLRQPISRGFLHTATSGGAPGFFYARCARNQVDRRLSRPRWLVAAIKEGKKLENFLIAKSGRKGRKKRKSK